ncbi:MAG TPA: metal ABC transporter substrate-binding protein [Polyangiaceae bacterium]|nr:metal ABC transporter substrate-binding protein [Polyangiaceae bacterium]
MKQLFIALLILTAVVLCPKPASAELRVVTTTTDLGYFASTIGSNKVHIDTICQGTQDPHFVQARPSYMVTLSRADLVVAVGLELEVGWLPSLIQGARNPAINPGRPGYFEASSAIQAIDIPQGGVDRSRGDIHPFGNPHFWLDPLNAKLATHAIAERMAQLDPANAEFFRANARAFEQRIDAKMAQWTAQMAPFKGTKIASYHATFNYFHKRFGLDGIGYLEDRPGIPPSPAHLVDLIRQIRDQHVPVIFHESFYDRSTSDMVGARSGAQVLVLPTSVGGANGTATYEQLIDTLINQFLAAMKKAKP